MPSSQRPGGLFAVVMLEPRESLVAEERRSFLVDEYWRRKHLRAPLRSGALRDQALQKTRHQYI